MREIRFRAWDKKEKCMVAVTQINWEEPYGVTISHGGSWHNEVENYHLMQFTGLQDKNGKEIYEGDIVENERGEIGEVVFASGAFVSKYIGEYAWDALEPCDGLMHRQIVLGNIYENPKIKEDI